MCLAPCSSLPRIFETLYPWVCNAALCPCQDTECHLEMLLDNKILCACQIWRGSKTSMKYNLHLNIICFFLCAFEGLMVYYVETLLYTAKHISMFSHLPLPPEEVLHLPFTTSKSWTHNIFQAKSWIQVSWNSTTWIVNIWQARNWIS